MKIAKIIAKIAAAAAVIGGIAYLVIKYYDEIKAWIQKICPCCALEDDFMEECEAEEDAPAAEEAPAAPVVEDETVPVADDADFAE